MEEKKKSSSSKKSKKRKRADSFSVEEHEELNDHIKNNKIVKKDSSDDHQKAGSQKVEFDGDSWSKEDYQELVRRMESQIPKLDKLNFLRRAEKLDWSQIQFKWHSEEECKEKWKVLKKKIRHFRLLSEVLEDAKTYIENPWKANITKKRRVRHPEEPSKPLSSYLLFYMDKKDKLIKKFPNLKMTEISRLIGGKYKALSEEHKAYYVEKAKEMKEEYKKNIAKFYEKYPEYINVPKPQKKDKTKRPCTPFKLYLEEKLLKHQHDLNFNRQELVEKYKGLWKNLSLKKKVYWIRLARDEQIKYLEHLQENLSGDEDKPALPHRSIINKEENAILERLAGKPEKPPNSAYALFSRLMLKNKEDYVDVDPKDRIREIANMWKELPDDQKKAYAERVQHMTETYKLEFANYLENLPKEQREAELAKLQPKKKVKNMKSKAAKVLKNEPPKRDIFQNEPEKPPLTAWDLYKNKYFKKNSHLPSEVAFKNAAASWKTLPPQKIEKYKKKYEKIKEKYMVDFEAFVKSLSEEELREYYSRSQSGAESDQNEDTEEDQDSSSEDSKTDGGSDGNSDDESDESDSGVSDEGWA